jgi:adenine-specific DNA methylase
MLAALQKQTGSFYTESNVAEALVNWAVRDSDDMVLEPSFGDGIFIEKIIARFCSLGATAPQITAVEILPAVVERATFSQSGLEIFTKDFLSLDLYKKYDVVIGNPPYVGIKNLPQEQKNSARRVINSYNVCCPNNGSLWFPFVLHSITTLRKSGRLAFVLPFEITYARYAYGLWNILSKNFSNLSVCRIYEDFFPNVDVETILLFAEGKGGMTSFVDYLLHDSVADLLNKNPFRQTRIQVADIITSTKPFVSSLLPFKQQDILQNIKKRGILKNIIESCKFKIGYVSADKKYFHPNREVVEKYSISQENLLACILNSKELNGGTGIGIEVLKGQCASKLFVPKKISEGESQYIRYGEKLGVQQKYKCRRRSPWYITPNIEIPEVILSVFGENPKMVVNKGRYAVSNSLLCGSLKRTTAEQFVCRWYNSLTLLSIELNVHSLGGGSFVIIPGEADRLEIVKDIPIDKLSHIYHQLNEALINSGTEAAYKLGDKLVLQEVFQLSKYEIEAIYQAIAALRNWRNPTSRRGLQHPF